MSSLISGITKIFTSFGSGLSKVATTLGSAVRGVGASLFTASAATGANAASSGLFGANSILGRMFGGVGSVTGAGAAAGAAGAASTVGASSIGSLAPTFTGSMTGGAGLGSALNVAQTATGFTPAGASAATNAVTGGGATGGFWNSGFGKFLGTEAGGLAIAGVGAGIGDYYTQKSEEDMLQKKMDFERGQTNQIRESYNVPVSAYAGGTPTNSPYAQQAARPMVTAKKLWAYNDQTGKIEQTAVA